MEVFRLSCSLFRGGQSILVNDIFSCWFCFIVINGKSIKCKMVLFIVTPYTVYVMYNFCCFTQSIKTI